MGKKRPHRKPSRPKKARVASTRSNSQVEIAEQLPQDQRRITIGTLTERDFQLLEQYGNFGGRVAAMNLGMKQERLYQRIGEIRKQIAKAENFLGQINSFRKRFPRVKKSFVIIEEIPQ